ncbi:hypothetical protein [Paraburkholderia heleia]|uniref:hypothetical protein n=1 Tax=Paraburkholderia heleia TaxID=634127 RepID=UPI0005A6D0CA|nr:hypothetical protein [Paraburkholderia heleia]
MTTQPTKRKVRVRHVKHASATNINQKSLVKAVIQNDTGEWVRPATGDKFYIDESPKFPSVVFEIKTDVPPPYQWKWTIVWDAQVSSLRESAKRGKKLRTFSQSGSFTSNEKSWEANLNDMIVGGKLSVQVAAGATEFRRTVFVLGKNPAKENVVSFIATMPNTLGFDKVVEQESHFKNFINADNEPVVAGDRGYGLTQMTNPAPSYEQIWNWKENIKVGVKLFQEKQSEAKDAFGHHPYTDDQLMRETFTRWNGGTYYQWNSETKQLERKNVLCDPTQGNIGWNMDNPSNAGRTADQLHERDKGQYSQMKAGQSKEHPWTYTGMCYVDHIFGN